MASLQPHREATGSYQTDMDTSEDFILRKVDALRKNNHPHVSPSNEAAATYRLEIVRQHFIPISYLYFMELSAIGTLHFAELPLGDFYFLIIYELFIQHSNQRHNHKN